MESYFVANRSHPTRTDFIPVVPLPKIIKNTTSAAADMIGNLGPRQSSSRGGGGAGAAVGGASVPPQGTASPMPQRTNSLRGERDGSRRGLASPITQPPPPEERYVVYIRLPFERRGFVDPPQVDWNDAKERYLWKVLSRSGRSTDLDWNVLATHLQVSRAFLLQQAAWLYERELSQIQAQMRRAGTSALITGLAGSPYSRPESPAMMGGIPMARTGTAGTVRSTPIVTPRPTPSLPPTPTVASRPLAQPMSRTGSSQTTRGIVIQAPAALATHRFSPHIPVEPPVEPPSIPSPEQPSSASDDYTESSTASASSDDEDNGNRLVRKLPPFLKKGVGSSSDEDDGDEEPAFLPFSQADKPTTSGDDPGMTGTVTLRRRISAAGTIKGKEAVRSGLRPVTDPSLEVGGTIKARRQRNTPKMPPMGSPKRLPVDSASLSTGPNSPSMGSSFSDLSDTSVTQSAMEEAYLSTMQGGGMASRMSSISQAVRSRYFPSN